MGNISVFVDAGYLFKQGSLALFGPAKGGPGRSWGRHEITFDPEPFMQKLSAWLCQRYPEDQLFRTYWYDGAKSGVPSTEQLAVASLSFVKLRLGRINSAGVQKGVDTLMVRDLMVLSQERSIHRAIVLSGDEDIREGIEYAQDRGVRVAVLGIQAAGGSSQSHELLREADEAILLPLEILEASVTRTPVVEPVSIATPAAIGSAAEPGTGTASTYREAAVIFAKQWIETAPKSSLQALLNGRPTVPGVVDGPLLRHVCAACNVRTIDDESRREIRIAFWGVIDRTV